MTGQKLYTLIKEFLDMCDLSFHEMNKITVDFKDDMIIFSYKSSDNKTEITWEYRV